VAELNANALTQSQFHRLLLEHVQKLPPEGKADLRRAIQTWVENVERKDKND